MSLSVARPCLYLSIITNLPVDLFFTIILSDLILHTDIATMAAVAVHSSSVPLELSRKATEDAVEKLQANVTRYTRANDRRMVLRSLKDAEFLSQMTLGTPILPPDICLSELEQELLEETVVLNDFSFKPSSSVERKDTFTNAGMNSGCLVILKGLTEGLCGVDTNGGEYSLDGKAVYEKLVARMARTSASVDIVDLLHALMGSPDLTVKHIASSQNSKTTATAPGIAIAKSSSYGSSNSDSTVEDKSIRVHVYEANGNIHMKLDMMLEFGLFRKSDTNMTRPWITLKTFLHERVNLSSGANYRVIDVKTPSLY